MSKSTCNDCVWKRSCQKLERLNGDEDKRNNPGRAKEIFEIIVLTCSTKNCDRSYKMGGDKADKKGGMYYCTECRAMHHEWSGIGRSHKRILVNRIS
jgi:hypothetical protein